MKYDALWFNLAADPEIRMAFRYVGSYKPALTVPGDERQGPSGRIRAFSNGAKSWAFSISFSDLTDEQVAFLTEHVGELMWFRDHQGRKRAGRFRSSPFTEALHPHEHTTSRLTFVEVTLREPAANGRTAGFDYS